MRDVFSYKKNWILDFTKRFSFLLVHNTILDDNTLVFHLVIWHSMYSAVEIILLCCLPPQCLHSEPCLDRTSTSITISQAIGRFERRSPDRSTQIYCLLPAERGGKNVHKSLMLCVCIQNALQRLRTIQSDLVNYSFLLFNVRILL